MCSLPKDDSPGNTEPRVEGAISSGISQSRPSKEKLSLQNPCPLHSHIETSGRTPEQELPVVGQIWWYDIRAKAPSMRETPEYPQGYQSPKGTTSLSVKVVSLIPCQLFSSRSALWMANSKDRVEVPPRCWLCILWRFFPSSASCSLIYFLKQAARILEWKAFRKSKHKHQAEATPERDETARKRDFFVCLFDCFFKSNFASAIIELRFF